MTTPKAYVLTFEWWEDDGWYGQYYRIVLSRAPKTFFFTKKEARKYNTAFKKMINDKYQKRIGRKVLVKDFICDERDKFETYRYCGAGPSYSCKEMEYITDELKEYMEEK